MTNLNDYTSIEFWKRFDNSLNEFYMLRYINFINSIKNKNRNLEHFENHHIIPRCMTRNIQNNVTVKLTFREHYIAHKILTKCFNNNYKYSLLHAFQYVVYSNNRGYVNSRDYEYLRTEYRKISMPEHTKKRISESHKGKYWTEEQRKRQSELLREKRKDPTKWVNKEYYHTEKRIKQALSNLEKLNKIQKGKNHPMYGKHHSEYSKMLISKNHYDCSGSNNGRYHLGLKWVSNKNLKKTKVIKPELVKQYLSEGWVLGRILNFDKEENKI